MSKKKPESNRPPLEALPEPLRMSVVRVMAKYGIDVDAAYDKIAVLADVNSPIFDEAVKAEGNTLYKRLTMKTMNAARTSINRAANSRLKAEYDRGFGDGYAKGRVEHQLYYYCKVCGKLIYIEPNREEHKPIIQYLFDRAREYNELIANVSKQRIRARVYSRGLFTWLSSVLTANNVKIDTNKPLDTDKITDDANIKAGLLKNCPMIIARIQKTSNIKNGIVCLNLINLILLEMRQNRTNIGVM